MLFRWCPLVALAISSGIAAAEESWNSPPYYPSPWTQGEGVWEDAYQKAVAFVSQLTLAEKVNLTTGVGWMQESCVGQVGSIPRLGFRSLCLQDGPLGIRFGDYVTAFPAGINVAATWSKELAYLRGKAMGEEFRDKGADIILGPAIGPIGRAPEGGRNWEGLGPDPVLAGQLVAETIKGMQKQGVIACAKHFIANEQERFRIAAEAQGYGFDISESLSSNVDDVTMHEIYLWPFADAVKAGVGSIMCSYNQINNSYGCGNSYTQNKLLKGELGFRGFILSDWQAHHSGVGSAFAGLDMSMPGDTLFGTGVSFWGANLTIAVANGTIPEWRVDDMAVRIMAAYYKVGRDKVQVPINFNSWTTNVEGYQHALVQEGYGVVNERVNVRDHHAHIARRVARDSTVLLKNEGVLPLTGKEQFTAIIGEGAGPNLNGPNSCPDRGCDNGTLAMGWGSGTTNFPYLVTPDDAIQREIVSKGVGNVMSVLQNGDFKNIQSVAGQADVSLVFINSNSGEGYISVDGNEGDRKNLTAWKGGEEMVKQVTSVCNNTVLVIHSSGPILAGEWHDNPNITAILWAGLPGQESGNALVDILYGKESPGGKSPFTWARTAEDYGTTILREPNNGKGAPQQVFSEGIFFEYRHFDKENITPVYEFGYGLSYTTFSYSNLRVRPMRANKYVPATGMTKPAPRLGHSSTNYADYLFPGGFKGVTKYIYPWLMSTDPKEASGDKNYGLPIEDYVPPNANNGNAQPVLPASGVPGGNPGLFEDLYEVSAIITNEGDRVGEEVPQLYVSLGGHRNAKIVLRGFDRIRLAPGQRFRWRTTLTRRDVSNWDPASQDWVMTEHPKIVYVGSSSRKLPLQAPLPAPNLA
ncbi:beta-glucosidase 1 [Nannizzia gypsea CBS 118893]|uniref:beta-glucosidase n=1 Tax=Arthroderma gypseum (strain ATCC MYA-4604 / CBS 118893) TaxID=535722 RepID=E5R3U9_ARTGP|nr:beta-glucosidase 1 [Nannizzia gypsea CBS 118893]EFQ98009.1 beta-glucosidase 1 [Nannizzia gypsea CBS 118893]